MRRATPDHHGSNRYAESLDCESSDYKDDPLRLRSLRIPTLVVAGAETVAFHRAINAALMRALPRAEAFELTGGHNSPASAPDYFVAEWLKFQERAAASGRNL